MDYKQRDNINNWLLRAFSIFGLLTIISGFTLYWVSSKSLKRRKRNRELASKNLTFPK
jgi:membrane protein insertase Oxa1/YidC/SpoIIIJ